MHEEPCFVLFEIKGAADDSGCSLAVKRCGIWERRRLRELTDVCSCTDEPRDDVTI